MARNNERGLVFKICTHCHHNLPQLCRSNICCITKSQSFSVFSSEQPVSDRHGLFARAKQLEIDLRATQVDLREDLETLQARLKVLVFERERLRWNDKVFARRIHELEKGITHASAALTEIAQGIQQLAARKTE